jgi:transposase-like protein
MNCTTCNSLAKKNGKNRAGAQKYKCLTCGKVFTTTEKLEGKRLSTDKIEMCIKLLVEGNSVRSTERLQAFIEIPSSACWKSLERAVWLFRKT